MGPGVYQTPMTEHSLCGKKCNLGTRKRVTQSAKEKMQRGNIKTELKSIKLCHSLNNPHLSYHTYHNKKCPLVSWCNFKADILETLNFNLWFCFVFVCFLLFAFYLLHISAQLEQFTVAKVNYNAENIKLTVIFFKKRNTYNFKAQQV